MRIVKTWNTMRKGYLSTGLYFGIIGVSGFQAMDGGGVWNTVGLIISAFLLIKMLDFITDSVAVAQHQND